MIVLLAPLAFICLWSGTCLVSKGRVLLYGWCSPSHSILAMSCPWVLWLLLSGSLFLSLNKTSTYISTSGIINKLGFLGQLQSTYITPQVHHDFSCHASWTRCLLGGWMVLLCMDDLSSCTWWIGCNPSSSIGGWLMLIPAFRAMHYLESRGVYGVVYFTYILFLFHVYSSTSTSPTNQLYNVVHFPALIQHILYSQCSEQSQGMC
jgi:hypothetical protein